MEADCVYPVAVPGDDRCSAAGAEGCFAPQAGRFAEIDEAATFLAGEFAGPKQGGIRRGGKMALFIGRMKAGKVKRHTRRSAARQPAGPALLGCGRGVPPGMSRVTTSSQTPASRMRVSVSSTGWSRQLQTRR